MPLPPHWSVARFVRRQAIGAKDASRLITAPDWTEAYPLLRERLAGDEVVLLKASRGVALEGILPLIERDF